jgi:hypothetical protein
MTLPPQVEDLVLVRDQMLGLVMAKPVSDRAIVRLIAGVLSRHERLRDELVIAAFGGAQDRVQDAADELDAATRRCRSVSISGSRTCLV